MNHRTLIITILSLFFYGINTYSQSQTLRVDYMFSGTTKSSEISLDEMSCFDGWAGRFCPVCQRAISRVIEFYIGSGK